MAISYRDVFGLEFDVPEDLSIQPGDIVRTGANLFPHFKVIAVHGDVAWVQNVSSGADALLPVLRCHKVLEG